VESTVLPFTPVATTVPISIPKASVTTITSVEAKRLVFIFTRNRLRLADRSRLVFSPVQDSASIIAAVPNGRWFSSLDLFSRLDLPDLIFQIWA
jgi:hypothetical protein